MSECEHPKKSQKNYHDNSIVCDDCNSVIFQDGKEIDPPDYLGMMPKYTIINSQAEDDQIINKLKKAKQSLGYHISTGDAGVKQAAKLIDECIKQLEEK